MTVRKIVALFIGTLLTIALLMGILAAATVESNALSGLESSGYVSKSTGAVLRQSASTKSKALAALPSNSPLVIYKEVFTSKKSYGAKNRWYYVNSGAGYGYLRSDFVAISKYGYAAGYAKKKLVYRMGAGNSMKKKGTIKKKKNFIILMEAQAKGSSKRWWKIYKNNKFYYVSSSGTVIAGLVSGVDKPLVSNPAKDINPSQASLAVINGACNWAINIANDNRFHYGKKPNSQHNGCYFCGTQVSLSDPTNPNNAAHPGLSKTDVLDYQYSYCCNPFVHAAFAHGGNEETMLSICKNFSSYDYKANHGYDVSPLFAKLGKPDMSDLRRGDVICWDNHVALYLGSGTIVESTGGDDNVRYSEKWNNSIRVCSLSSARYEKAQRCYRYIGKGQQ